MQNENINTHTQTNKHILLLVNMDQQKHQHNAYESDLYLFSLTRFRFIRCSDCALRISVFAHFTSLQVEYQEPHEQWDRQ